MIAQSFVSKEKLSHRFTLFCRDLFAERQRYLLANDVLGGLALLDNLRNANFFRLFFAFLLGHHPATLERNLLAIFRNFFSAVSTRNLTTPILWNFLCSNIRCTIEGRNATLILKWNRNIALSTKCYRKISLLILVPDHNPGSRRPRRHSSRLPWAPTSAQASTSE